MASHEDALLLTDAERSLSVLNDYLDRFISVWESDQAPPALADALPPEGKQRRLVLTELIKVDLEYRWLVWELPKTLGDYAREFPELAVDGMPVDLIYEEFHIRRQAGDQVELGEYLQEYPQRAAEIRRLLEAHSPYVATGIGKGNSRRQLDAVTVGQSIDDFELLAELGQGAFARIFLVRQTTMQRLVALKITVDRGCEPQTLAQLDHDHIVRVYDLRNSTEPPLQLLYMQYVPAGTLHAVIARLKATTPESWSGALLLEFVDEQLQYRGLEPPVESSLRERIAPWSWPQTVAWIGARLAEALDYAHRQGILHRDVKPANVLLTAEGSPKLADFNTSCSSKLDGASPAAYFGGSLAYMSPEQLQACNPAHRREPDSLDGRSDLYSLCVLLWELLTAQRPCREEPLAANWSTTLEAMTERRLHLELPDHRLRSSDPLTTQALRNVIAIGLAALPEHRWQTGDELAKQLSLTTQPAAYRLLYPAATAWSTGLRRWATLIIVIGLMLPNILAGWFNYAYNKREIIEVLQGSQQAFWRTQLVINSIAYPLGIVVACWLAIPVIRRLRQAKARLAERKLRHRSLYLGGQLALLSVAEWVVAGIAYPLAIHLASGTMTASAAFHFFSSLLICGLIAAVYPFFLITPYALRVLYPHLLQGNLQTGEDIPALERVQTLARGLYGTAFAIPMLGIFALVQLGSTANFALQALCLVGLLGCGLILFLNRRLQRDTEAVKQTLAGGR